MTTNNKQKRTDVLDTDSDEEIALSSFMRGHTAYKPTTALPNIET